MTDEPVDPLARFFGAALIAVGVLMMLLCGGCGALFFVGYLVAAFVHPSGVGMMILPLLLGGIPALIGFGLFAGGRRLRRPKGRSDQPLA